MLEYQNKALATLVRKHKQKIQDLRGELERSAVDRAALEANLAQLSNKLITVSLYQVSWQKAI